MIRSVVLQSPLFSFYISIIYAEDFVVPAPMTSSRKKETGHSRKVYKLLFDVCNGPDHTGLFIEKEEGRGDIFHVVIRDESRAGSKQLQTMVYEAKPFNTKTSHSLRQKVYMGTVSRYSITKFHRICEEMPPPVAPNGMKDGPNCITWIDNVVYDLGVEGVVRFASKFIVPSEKKQLRFPHKK